MLDTKQTPYFEWNEEAQVLYFFVYDANDEEFLLPIYSDDYGMVLLSALTEQGLLTQDEYTEAVVDLMYLFAPHVLPKEVRSYEEVQRSVDFALFSLLSEYETSYQDGSVFFSDFIADGEAPVQH